VQALSFASATDQTEEAWVLGAMQADDEGAFVALAERYRQPLHTYLYRLVGSVEDAEDLVQETFLRAWRGRAAFEGRSKYRTWLYSIATNTALNALQRNRHRVLPQDVARPADVEPRSEPSWAPELPWLRPYPDHLLEPRAPSESEPDAVVVRRETIELAYLAAIQHLPPRQRAILVLDALDWTPRETAALLETSVASVNSALQRARSTMRTRVPRGRSGWTPAEPSDRERATLQRFMDALEEGDSVALTALLREDAQWAMPPARLWFDGRAAIAQMFDAFPIGWQGDFQMRHSAANRQPAAACYLRLHGQVVFRLVSLFVLRIEAGLIADVIVFQPDLFRAFGLPPSL
jgi:RNA polymerase sigma-70 factor, ECF subfamily